MRPCKRTRTRNHKHSARLSKGVRGNGCRVCGASLTAASGIASASTMKRKASSMGTSSHAGCSMSPKRWPPPVPDLVSAPVLIMVHRAPLSAAVFSAATSPGAESAALRWTKMRCTPAALAAASCASNSFSSAFTATHVFRLGRPLRALRCRPLRIAGRRSARVTGLAQIRSFFASTIDELNAMSDE